MNPLFNAANLAQGTVYETFGSGINSIKIATGHTFPAPPFRMVLHNPGAIGTLADQYEYMEIASVSDTQPEYVQYSVQARDAQTFPPPGSSREWAAGTAAYCMATAADFTDIWSRVPAPYLSSVFALVNPSAPGAEPRDGGSSPFDGINEAVEYYGNTPIGDFTVAIVGPCSSAVNPLPATILGNFSIQENDWVGGPTILGMTVPTEWAATTAYALGDYVYVAGEDFWLRCDQAGTSGAAAPSGFAYGDFINTDGTVWWTAIDFFESVVTFDTGTTLPEQSQYLQFMPADFDAPVVDGTLYMLGVHQIISVDVDEATIRVYCPCTPYTLPVTDFSSALYPGVYVRAINKTVYFPYPMTGSGGLTVGEGVFPEGVHKKGGELNVAVSRNVTAEGCALVTVGACAGKLTVGNSRGSAKLVVRNPGTGSGDEPPRVDVSGGATAFTLGTTLIPEDFSPPDPLAETGVTIRQGAVVDLAGVIASRVIYDGASGVSRATHFMNTVDALIARRGSYVNREVAPTVTNVTNTYSPALDTVGNGQSLIDSTVY